MAVNKGTNVIGYVFPNVPGNWSPEEKRFALALRGLFDILFQKTRGLQTDIEEGATKGPDSRPQVDYLSMMSEIDILTDTSDKAEKIAGYYEAETWNEKMVWDAVEKWITAADYEDITGEPYSPYHD